MEDKDLKKCSFETALDKTGFGKYNLVMLAGCCFLILAMYMDMFGMSIILPSVACDMSLNTAQQGIIAALPLVGVTVSSYGWGLAADTIGRRKTLLIAMPIGFVFGEAASFAPNYTSLAVLKFFSVMSTSAANAAAFVLVAESVPSKNRSRFMFIMASATMFVMCLICCCALPIFKLRFYYPLSWLGIVYRPWRAVLQVAALPSAIGILILLFLEESPKFLLSQEKNEEALAVLQRIHQSNSGSKKVTYHVTDVWLDEPLIVSSPNTSFLRKMWNQTAPLFKPPLLKSSLILYYLLLCAYMTSTGYSMWVPTMTNAFFKGEDSSGRTFCEVASTSTKSNITNVKDCDDVIQPNTLYAVMCYSGVSTVLTILLSFVVGPMGKKRSTLMVFSISLTCGILLFFVRIPLLSIALFYMFLYVAQILGNVNTYLVDLNPTHLRGMASCLSVVVSRGFGFFSVQLIGSLLSSYCTPMLGGYVLLVVSLWEQVMNYYPDDNFGIDWHILPTIKIAGLIVATLLPPDFKKESAVTNGDNNSKTSIVGKLDDVK